MKYRMLFVGLLGSYLCAQFRIPGRGPTPSRQPQQQGTSKQDSIAKTVSIKGVVRSADEKSLVVDATDFRTLTFKITPATRFSNGLALSKLKPGDPVQVGGTQDDEAFLTATDVAIDQTAKPASPATATAPETADDAPRLPGAGNTVVNKPSPADPDDDGPPRLRYGKPDEKRLSSRRAVQDDLDKPYQPPPLIAAASAPSVPTPAREVSEAAPKTGDPKRDLIERARQEALSFTESMPNYICQQFTTRYIRGPGSHGWQAKDIVSANVVYENGKEDYRNIQINGKAITKKMEELPGSWSTGEFATTLRSLFHPYRRAVFTFVKQTQIDGMITWAYDYAVKREYSDWRVQLGSQAIIPAYSGRVWIDTKTARTLRIEMQADNIPEDFPLDKVEATNDYGFVRLATTDQYLLPTRAENLSCERGTTVCSRNAIEFRNYHKFTGETNITFDK